MQKFTFSIDAPDLRILIIDALKSAKRMQDIEVTGIERQQKDLTNPERKQALQPLILLHQDSAKRIQGLIDLLEADIAKHENLSLSNEEIIANLLQTARELEADDE